MCSNRNVPVIGSLVSSILDHWEMCSNRNYKGRNNIKNHILDHWEMCSNRNGITIHDADMIILDHWEMCSNRNKTTRIIKNIGAMHGCDAAGLHNSRHLFYKIFIVLQKLLSGFAV